MTTDPRFIDPFSLPEEEEIVEKQIEDTHRPEDVEDEDDNDLSHEWLRYDRYDDEDDYYPPDYGTWD